MAEAAEANLAPVAGRARIDVLDVMRGIAILGILFINVPYMAAPVAAFTADVRLLGWTPADEAAWGAVYLFWSGTQRCLLQFLFGAGMMILARKAMTPDGPVAVADLYYRRNLWLLLFGVFDAVVLFWAGDILQIYALAALFLFPFRTLGPKTLVTLGLGWALFVAVGIPEYGVREYVGRTVLTHQIATAEAHQRSGATLDATDNAALAEWHKVAEPAWRAETPQRIAEEKAAHAGGFLPYAKRAWRAWVQAVEQWLVWDVIEAFCTMLIGVALWKWGVIQGARSRGFYLGMMIAGYGIGVTARAIGLSETLSFSPAPRTIWFTAEFARLAVGLGHLALINFAFQTRFGQLVLAPFKAAGRMAFSLYFLQQFLGMWVLFAPWGLNLWGHFGWASMVEIALAMILFELVVANLWLRGFTAGPLEWLWRSLSYVQWQPIRRAGAGPAARGALNPSS